MATFDAVLQKLRPGADYSNPDGTLAHVRWDTPGIVPPTQQEFDAVVAQIASEESEAVAKAAPVDPATRALIEKRAADYLASTDVREQIKGLKLLIDLKGG